MKKLLLILFFLCTICTYTLAQERTVTGVVTSGENGQPIVGVTVKVKEIPTMGVSTDADGKFSIKVPPQGKTLVFSSISFDTQETAITGGVINVTLSASSKTLSEVVVVALGQTREKNTLSYAAQQVKGEELSQTRIANAASALSGKVSGLQIIQGNTIGGSTNVVIRGNKSLTGNNQALFVVDGIPVDNSNNNRLNQTTGKGGYDYGNAAADINPDDIESVNVLKGAAASALYGSRGANGVIMITTKSKKEKGWAVNVNSGLTIGNIDKKTFPTYQKEYGAGYSDPYESKDGFWFFDVSGKGKEKVVPTSEDASFGAKFDPNLLVYHWDAFDPTSPNYLKKQPWIAAANGPSTFFERAISNNNNLMLSGTTEKGSYKLGYTRNDERGVLPNSKVVKNIINFGATHKIIDRLTASASANFSIVSGLGRYGTGYDQLNVILNFRQWYQTNVDIQAQKAAYFRTKRNITWNWRDPRTPTGLVPLFFDNFYWTSYENYENDTRNRIFGNASVNYNATDWLNILGRVTIDSYDEIQEERKAKSSYGTPYYNRTNRVFNETNFDLLANFDKNITKDFNLKALLGGNIRTSTLKSIYLTTAGGLDIANLYAISNSLGAIPPPEERYEAKEVDGYFGGLTLGYKGFLNLEGTFRTDKSSTLPAANNAYSYYSVSGSWLFSKNLENKAEWLSLGKVRANYATVGNDAPWGSIEDAYITEPRFNSKAMFKYPPIANNPSLKPEQTRSFELGLEMSFLKERLGLDVSYYATKTKDQIVPVSVSAATGFLFTYVNSGIIQNKGFEASLRGTPIKTKDFSWNINLNWSRNRNKVLLLYGESKNLQIATYQGGVSINASLGQPYGTIQGSNFVYNDKGQKVVDADGYYKKTVTTTNVIGNINPNWVGGIYNTFKYKSISLGFLIDIRSGGSVWSLDQHYASYTGILPNTVGLNDLGNPVRDPVTKDSKSGGIILEGVTEDGKVNTTRVPVSASSKWLPTAAYAYDASYVKLREATIGFSFPKSMIAKWGAIKGIDLSVFGRNLWIIHKKLPYSDPEENLSSGNAQGIQSGAYPTTRTIGLNAKLSF